MKAKTWQDTVIGDEQIARLKVEAEKLAWSHKAHPRFEQEKHLLQAQAESTGDIAFKAGERKVVEWLISHKRGYFAKPDGTLISVVSAEWTEEEWKALAEGVGV